MASTFQARIDELRRMTGMPGDMTGRLIVDQLRMSMPTGNMKNSRTTILAGGRRSSSSSLSLPSTRAT